MVHSRRRFASASAAIVLLAGSLFAQSKSIPAPIELNSGWQLQDSAKVSDPAATVSTKTYQPTGWLAATVPGTVLTSLVNDKIYPEPTYGENNRESIIPESLNKTSWWYRTTFTIPRGYAHQQIWIHFDGANFTSEVWINGTQVGTIQGAFIRGRFDITKLVKPGDTAVVAVKVTPQPHPGEPHEHNIANGVGKNGGITAIDGPTFLCTIGWDWLNAVRDRDTGLWQKVWLSASGPVLVDDPLVITDLPLPKTDTADITVKSTLVNTSSKEQTGILEGAFGSGAPSDSVTFSQKITLKPNETLTVSVDPKSAPALHISNPKLWWPNGYGPQNLYTLHLHFQQHGADSDAHDTTFGIRKITYEAPGIDALTISVNGVKVFIRGGDWGLDEALKRIPRARLDAEIHMHALANMNLIRNWVGQSTGEDFYELCDKYGILIWDEFFQPNPSDGPNPDNFDIYMANVRDKILRYRNHPSIALWCARNEGFPPPDIDAALRKLIPELDPARLYQPSSTSGRGVHSGGPYYWREPRAFYVFDAPFKTETGSMSVPTIESIHGMMPEKDWNTINDDWGAHDFAKGAQHGDTYPYVLAGRYGRVANLADFVRKAQMMNYEAYRAMYEARNKLLFAPATGVITWMSNPAQPSFTWQLYHYDLEPNASLFAVKSASEQVHIQMDEDDFHLRVINNLPTDLSGYTAHVAIYTGYGNLYPALQKDIPVSGPADTAIDLGPTPMPKNIGPIYIAQLELRDPQNQIVSRNLYWEPNPEQGDDLTPLDWLPTVKLEASITRHDTGSSSSSSSGSSSGSGSGSGSGSVSGSGSSSGSASDAAARLGLEVTLKNPSHSLALMTHLQLRRKSTGDRILPAFFSDNYISLAPGESRTVTIDAALADLKGDTPLVVVDGWNIDVTPVANADAALALNDDAQVSHWPATGLPMITSGLPMPHGTQ